jgi:ABC-type transporter Mla MlaB component
VLKIIHQSDSPVLTLEGTLREPWIGELERMVEQVRADSGKVELDLSELTYVDSSGLKYLRELTESHEVRIIACSTFVAALLGLNVL